MAPSNSQQDVRQIGLIDLFALVTLAALLTAMAAPFLRDIQAAQISRLIILGTIQAIALSSSAIYSSLQRKKLLSKAGVRIAVVFYGGKKWKHWPLVSSVGFMFLFASMQLGIALVYAHLNSGTVNLNGIFVQAQLGYFTGLAVCRYLWRVFPGSIEFYNNGVALGGTKLLSWHQVDLSPSRLFSDRIRIVIRPVNGVHFGDTKTAHVGADLRNQLLALAESADHEDRQLTLSYVPVANAVTE